MSNDETDTTIEESDEFAHVRRIVREELRAAIIGGFNNLVAARVRDAVLEMRGIETDLFDRSQRVEGPQSSTGTSDEDLRKRVLAAFHGAPSPDQAQAVTYLAKHLDARPKDVQVTLRSLETEGLIYARPHMRSFLYYLKGHGPGAGRAKR